jgi:hypothetical protein
MDTRIKNMIVNPYAKAFLKVMSYFVGGLISLFLFILIHKDDENIHGVSFSYLPYAIPILLVRYFVSNKIKAIEKELGDNLDTEIQDN